MRGGYYSFESRFIRSLPIIIPGRNNNSEPEIQSLVVNLVGQMLELCKKRSFAKDSSEQDRLQRMIDSTDQHIDALVYKLYGLTKEEIAVMENSK
jgi:hypothetical protein